MKVKICGITTLEDAQKAIECGADAIGFVMYPHSVRYIEPFRVAEILSKLPPFVVSVGVFAQDLYEDVQQSLKESLVHIAQLHNEKLFAHSYLTPSLKVARIRQRDDLLDKGGEYWLCDSFCEAYGGMGKRIRLDCFEGLDCSRFILAGGLNAENLQELTGFGFYGVDVSSGVEAKPGKKDWQKLERFIKNAKKI